MKTVIHDWDGTIKDSNEAVLKAYSVVIKKPLEYVRENYDPNWKEFLKRENVPEPSCERWNDLIGSFEPGLFQGAERYLKRLHNKNFKLGLVTGSNALTIGSDLKKYNLEGFFDVIVTFEQVKKLKPDPEGIVLAIEKIGAAPSDCTYVGDTVVDAIASKSAGVKFVGVGWGLDSPEEIIRVNNDKVALSFEGLYRIVTRF